MNLKEASEKNKILKIKIGSQLYGTSTPTSDTDYSGIFIADEDYYFGLLTVKESDNSVESKDSSGKNTSEAVDDKLYEIRNFARLAMQNNPNIIEQLFVDDKNIVYANESGFNLLDNSDLFPYKGAYDRFIGYSVSQKHKMIIKEKHFNELLDAFNYFDCEHREKYIIEYKDKNFPFLKENNNYFTIGDLNFQKHVTLKKVCEILDDRLSKITNRSQLVLKHGYDTKFGSHLIRLLLEGEELLLTGEIVFPLAYADLLLDIKMGKYEVGKLLEMSTQFENRMRDAKERSKLPSKPKFDDINNLVKKMTKSFFLK